MLVLSHLVNDHVLSRWGCHEGQIIAMPADVLGYLVHLGLCASTAKSQSVTFSRASSAIRSALQFSCVHATHRPWPALQTTFWEMQGIKQYKENCPDLQACTLEF